MVYATRRSISLNKRKCNLLAAKANSLVATLQDHASKLEGTELQVAVDEVIA